MENKNTEISTVFPIKLKTYWIIIAIQAVFNIGLYTFLLDGAVMTWYLLISAIVGELFVIPILSFIIGSILSFIPYKKFSYAEKYLSSVLLCILIFNFLFTLVVLYGLANYISSGSLYKVK